MESLIEAGWTPIWLGTNSTNFPENVYKQEQVYELIVKLIKDGKYKFRRVSVSPEVEPYYTALTRPKLFYDGYDDKDDRYVGWVNRITGVQSVIRLAHVLGYGPLRHPELPFGEFMQVPSDLRIMGLDIEQSTFYRGSGFALPTDPLISVALTLSTGKFWCRYAIGKVDMSVCCPDSRYDVSKCSSSRELADWALELIISECPDFVVIHNGFKYDIPVLAAHCSPEYSYLFKEMRLGKTGVGCDLNIKGVTVIDTYHYLSKLHNGEYASFGLNSISEQLGLPSKMDFGTFAVDPNDQTLDMTDMVVYNIVDAYLHTEVAVRSRTIEEMLTMSCVFSSPLNDVSRFISGTLVGLLVSRYARNSGRVLEWSTESASTSKYMGGYVMPPKPGLYKKIVVFDFSSLYPSLIITANISGETVRLITDTSERLEVTARFGMPFEEQDNNNVRLAYDMSEICIIIGNDLGLISRSVRGIASEVMSYLIDKRNSLKDRSSPEGWALKIGANSFYGALGSNTSGLGMRFAAASVTALGRIIIEKLILFLTNSGFSVIYGDTDSVFIDCGSASNGSSDADDIDVDSVLRSFHDSLKGTVFERVVLNYETTFKSFIMLKRKMYYGIKEKESKIVIKGMASKRRDRPNIARTVSAEVCYMLCTIDDENDRNNQVSDYLYSVYRQIKSGSVDKVSCMLETKEGTTLVWKYESVDETYVTIEKDRYNDSIAPLPSSSWVIKFIKQSVSGVLGVSGALSFDAMIQNGRSRYDDLDSMY